MAKLICAFIIMVLLGIMFPSCDGLSVGHQGWKGGPFGRRELLRSKIYHLDTFHSNNKGADDYHKATDSIYDRAYDKHEAADENYEAVNKNYDVTDNYYEGN